MNKNWFTLKRLLPITSPVCDICNGRKDKPKKVTLRWVGTAGAKTSIMFSSGSTCVKSTQLTSNSAKNEVVLDASACPGVSGYKLPTDVYITVDGSSKYLHASCSQSMLVDDVVYKNAKGSLIIVGFKAMSGRTEHDCGGRFTTTTTPAPTTTPGPCKGWCQANPTSWSLKCGFSGCGGCPICSAKPGH